MQFLILAAGRGKRINKITSSYPKCLIKFKKGTILSKLIQQSNIIKAKELKILTGYKHKIIVNYLKKKKIKRVKVYNVKRYTSCNNFYTLFKFRSFLKNKDSLILFSDLIFDDNILKKFNKIKKDKICVFVDQRKVRKGTMKVLCKNNYLNYINSKKKKADGNFIGIAFIPKKKSNLIVEMLEKKNPEYNNKYYVDIFNELIKKKEKIKILNIFDYWTEIDTLKDLNHLRKNFNET